MNAVAAGLGWPMGQWAFDGRKNMYSPFTQLVPGDALVRQVRGRAGGRAAEGAGGCGGGPGLGASLGQADTPLLVSGGSHRLGTASAGAWHGRPRRAVHCSSADLLLSPTASVRAPPRPARPASLTPSHEPCWLRWTLDSCNVLLFYCPQVEVSLEGDARPRSLEVTIRRVATIPISVLKDFMRWAGAGRAGRAGRGVDGLGGLGGG